MQATLTHQLSSGDVGAAAVVVALHAAGFWALIQYAPAREAISDAPTLVFSLVKTEQVPTELPKPMPQQPNLQPVRPRLPQLAATTNAPTAYEALPLPVELPKPVAIEVPPTLPVPSPVAAPAHQLPVTPPETSADYANNQLPQYPVFSRRMGEEGKLQVHVCVKVDGTVSSATVTKSSGSERLDRATTDALLQWRFKPAKRGSEPVPGCVTVPWAWSLSN